MWFPTILTVIVHLFISGFGAMAVDYVNKDYTTTAFIMYWVTVTTFSIKNHFDLLAGLMYDREETLKVLDERLNEEK